MGSSPVTATIRSRAAAAGPRLERTLERFFTATAPLRRGQPLLVAFSGGGDSTALLSALARLAPARGWQLRAAHLDHGLDAASAQRARAAAALAARLGVPCLVDRREVRRGPGEGPEAAARRVRYAYLEECRRSTGALYLVTAHQLDDQAETVLLRLLFGSRWPGLAAMRPVSGTLVRPLLELPRALLAAAVDEAGLTALDDPTNADLRRPRNLVRHALLPALAGARTDLPAALARLARRAGDADARVEAFLLDRLRPRARGAELEVERDALAALPPPLLDHALGVLQRRAGAAHAPAAAAAAVLRRRLGEGAPCAVDAGGGWRWRTRGSLVTVSAAPEPKLHFTYTLRVPGTLAIPELALRLRLQPAAVEPWMYTGAARRAGLALPLRAGDTVTVRSRRPGDRLRPLGGRGTRRLKEVLIDRHIPRLERDRLPLLCVGEHIAWVPGVTIAEAFRLGSAATRAWVAEIEPG